MLSKVSVVEVFMHYFQNLSSASAPTNNILVTYGALEVLYCIVLYCILEALHQGPDCQKILGKNLSFA